MFSLKVKIDEAANVCCSGIHGCRERTSEQRQLDPVGKYRDWMLVRIVRAGKPRVRGDMSGMLMVCSIACLKEALKRVAQSVDFATPEGAQLSVRVESLRSKRIAKKSPQPSDADA